MRSRKRTTNRFDAATPGEARWHSHEGGQFILVESGLSQLHTARGTWIVPPRRIAWVPPRVLHCSRPEGRGKGWVVIAPKAFARELPDTVCVLRASTLMIASLERLTALEPDETRMRRLMWRVVAEEMTAVKPEPFGVPMPSEPRLLKAVQAVLTAPTAAANVDRIAARARMSRRTFVRHFRSQTGLSFSRWKRAVIAQHALELIGAGHKVSSVAFDVGYHSVSAFISMFRRQYGDSPRHLLDGQAERYLPAKTATSGRPG
jgi:AraC-like DNA-binding protein